MNPAASASRARNARGEGGRLRADIVSAAARLLDENGGRYDALSLRAVAREAGVAAPSIYAHFPTLDAVIATVVAETFAELTARFAAALDKELDPVRRLVAGCQAYVAFGLAKPARYRVLFGQPVPSHQKDAAGVAMTDVHARGQEAFGELVEGVTACVRAGRSHSTDPVVDALRVWTALHGIVTLRVGAGPVPWSPVSEDIDIVVRRIALLSDGDGDG